MHVPDGILSAPVAVACAALSGAGVVAAAGRARARLGSRAVALMGVTAAFVFSAQMINFPVAGGTSGHVVGGVLAAVLLGPSAAVVVMTAVLAMQCLVFGDGGLLALGANVLNMAILHPVAGFALYRAIAGSDRPGRAPQPARRLAAVAFASWAATVLAAATCAGEIALSGVAAPVVVLPAMVGVHAVIGLGEAVIASLVVATILRLRPGLVGGARSPEAGGPVPIVVLGLVPALALGLFLTPFASRWPDGLERVVERLGVEPSRMQLPAAPLRDYGIPGLAASSLTTSLVAALGTVLVFALSVALGSWLASSSRS
jgi:cobalt/nickel transport system permease protein